MKRVIQFGLSILLMRLLGPSAFGLIAMVLVFTEFARVLGDLGFASAVVQNSAIDEVFEATAFWSVMATGTLFALLFWVGAPFIASFFASPVLEAMTRVVSLGFIVTSVGAVPRALLKKRMRFGPLAVIDAISVTISGGAAVLFAFLGAGVWALVVQKLAQDVLQSVLSWIAAQFRPAFHFSSEAFRNLVGFGGGLTGFNIINYWSRNADDLLIGRIFGSVDLGFYTRAYTLMLLPLSQVLGSVGPVLFPALASIQDDEDRVKRVFLRVLRATTFLTFPMSLGLIAVAEPFVLTLLGSDWIRVIPLLQILAVAGAISSAVSPLGSVFLAQERTIAFFYVGLASGGLNLLGIVAGTLMGDVIFIALGVMAAHMISLFVNYVAAGRLFGIGMKDVARAVSQNLIHAVAMLLIVLLTARLLSPVLSEPITLGVLITVGIIAYLSLALITDSRALADALLLVRSRALFPTPKNARQHGSLNS